MELEEPSAAQEPLRIIVCDDHPLFRSAISHTLEAQPGIEVVAEAADGQEALELCRHLSPDLVLMDLRMPVMDGVAAARAIREELPDTLVLVLTALDESEGLSNALEAGAAGYVLKDAPASRIAEAVRRTLAGENPLDEKVAMRLLTSLMKGKTRQEEATERGGTRGSPHYRGTARGEWAIATRQQPPHAPRGRGPAVGGEGANQPADRPAPWPSA